MQDLATAQNHCAARVIPPVICNRPEDIASVEALSGYRLQVCFHDGVQGVVDLSRRVRSPNAGVFAALADQDRFEKVSIEFGAVWWPGDIDLAPDAMHAELKANGCWML